MITKEEFEKVYNKYLPNKLEVFWYKYFSKSTIQKDKWLVNRLTESWGLCIILGIIFSALDWNIMIAIVFWLFLLTFIPFCIVGWISVIIHKIRLWKIRKKLGISKQEYNKLEELC